MTKYTNSIGVNVPALLLPPAGRRHDQVGCSGL